MNSPKLGVMSLILLSFMGLTTFASATTSVDFSNGGGTLSGSNAGLTLTGSTLIAVVGWNGSSSLITGSLGTVTFTTGALTDGSLGMGGTFAAGGSFEVDSNGTGGLSGGTLFSGTFSGPVTWTLTTLANGTHNYTLTGVITGTMSGMTVDGVSVQLTVNTGKSLFSGSALISGGDTTVASVPEPSSMALLGTGALALAGLARRKLRAR
jgi:PEP-CTERM motif